MNNLKEIRKTRFMTQEQLAKELGVTSVTISRYETGAHQLSVPMAKRIAKVLHVNWWELFE